MASRCGGERVRAGALSHEGVLAYQWSSLPDLPRGRRGVVLAERAQRRRPRPLSESHAASCSLQVLDTAMYTMREGGTAIHTVRDRDVASFKSAEQIAREEAQEQLFAHLEVGTDISISISI